MTIQVGDTVRWRTHPNYEAIVTDIQDDVYVLNVYRPRRFEMRLHDFEIELIPVDELQVELKPEDIEALKYIYTDMALDTLDRHFFNKITNN